MRLRLAKILAIITGLIIFALSVIFAIMQNS